MKKIIVYILLLVSTVAASCNKFLEEKPEDFDFLSPENFPQTDKDAELMLAGTLNRVRAQGYYDRGFYFVSEIGGELVNSVLPVQARLDFDYYTWNAGNENTVTFWQQAYSAIDGANTMIKKIPVAPKMTDEKKAQYVGTARFIRAMAYFDLVRAFGDLPLLTEPVTEPEKALSLKRSPIKDVYDVIVADLQYAGEKLPETWSGGAGRPVKMAARALLSRVYLTMAGEPLKDASKWAKAVEEAKAVVANGKFRLLPDFGNLWKIANNNNAEVLFAIQFYTASSGGTMMAVQSRPLNAGNEAGWGFWTTTEAFMNEFPDDDKRKAATFLTSLGGLHYKQFTAPQPCLAKWSDAGRAVFLDKNRRTDLAVPVIRYAEVLLNLAEAENEANGPAGAYAAIDEVRKRAGLGELQKGLSQEAFRQAVRLERKHELAFEYNRRFDLIRWGLLDQVMGNDPLSKAAYKSFKKLYPIPENEISINPNIKQNDGY